MTLNGYSSDDAVRQIRHADMTMDAQRVQATHAQAVQIAYLRAIAVALAAIAARMEE